MIIHVPLSRRQSPDDAAGPPDCRFSAHINLPDVGLSCRSCTSCQESPVSLQKLGYDFILKVGDPACYTSLRPCWSSSSPPACLNKRYARMFRRYGVSIGCHGRSHFSRDGLEKVSKKPHHRLFMTSTQRVPFAESLRTMVAFVPEGFPSPLRSHKSPIHFCHATLLPQIIFHPTFLA